MNRYSYNDKYIKPTSITCELCKIFHNAERCPNCGYFMWREGQFQIHLGSRWQVIDPRVTNPQFPYYTYADRAAGLRMNDIIEVKRMTRIKGNITIHWSSIHWAAVRETERCSEEEFRRWFRPIL